ncbi:MAG TPA: translation initiation factor [Bacteroidetes bacterium]|nr:translation initiation factor [Bacteroidota bacterium]
MMKRHARQDGLVYSTGAPPPERTDEPAGDEPAARRKRESAVIRLERRGRGGKTVTIVELRGFGEEKVRETGRRLKRHCGCGGTVKGDLVELQGDRRDAARLFLEELGITARG